jgi:hypothetical protein
VKYGTVSDLDVASDLAFFADARMQDAVLLHTCLVANYDGSVVSSESGSRAYVTLSADPDIAYDRCVFINVCR